jgi:hypothetical protein
MMAGGLAGEQRVVRAGVARSWKVKRRAARVRYSSPTSAGREREGTAAAPASAGGAQCGGALLAGPEA